MHKDAHISRASKIHKRKNSVFTPVYFLTQHTLAHTHAHAHTHTHTHTHARVTGCVRTRILPHHMQVLDFRHNRSRL